MDMENRINRIREREYRIRDYYHKRQIKSQKRRFLFWRKPVAALDIPVVNPPLSEADVSGFEHQFDVLLPHEYREFVLRVAISGSGPYGGLLPLNAGEGDISKPFPFTESWISNSNDDRDDLFDGTLMLADMGCGYTALLVVTGEARNTVWEDYTCGEGGIHPKSKGFLDWYEHP